MSTPELTAAREFFGDPDKLIAKIQATARKPKGPALYELVQDYFKARKFTSFTTKDLIAAFPQRDPEAVRNAVRRLIRTRDVKATGEINWKRWHHHDHPTDHAYLTATLYKT